MKKVAVFAAVVLALSTGSAFAVSQAVKDACSADYVAYCGKFKVGTAALKSCMREHRHMLGAGCIKALGQSSEVTAEDIAQYKRENGK
ncbi:hypothetical protein HYPDE_34613 [Hyphomicrobium denitrificans 1NES1]|uniref:Uncharacterized protein n=1 Tax=Hyphomicrobium denitrificans 1NES1 TaxID=670307 RepID=N0B508_9HYPH|nr:hypothetical protein [Hyphomicrobium denitrificans]AGK58594.1 hypothetical protein HYPDE_34613 [Hyphomicrobium denitrificans 1NES1]